MGNSVHVLSKELADRAAWSAPARLAARRVTGSVRAALLLGFVCCLLATQAGCTFIGYKICASKEPTVQRRTILPRYHQVDLSRGSEITIYREDGRVSTGSYAGQPERADGQVDRRYILYGTADGRNAVATSSIRKIEAVEYSTDWGAVAGVLVGLSLDVAVVVGLGYALSDAMSMEGLNISGSDYSRHRLD